MSGTIFDYAQSYLIIRQILEREANRGDATEEEVDSAKDLIIEIEQSLIDTWRASIRLFGEAPPAPANIVPMPGVTPDAGVDSFDYARFVALFEKYSVPPTDGIRKWFSDVGGWDKATSADKVAIYNKAQDYYAGRDPNAEHDKRRCYACGSPGDAKTTRDGETYYTCSNRDCGFQGNSGWVTSSWDENNWEEKRSRLRGGGRGRGGGGRGGSRYGGRR